MNTIQVVYISLTTEVEEEMATLLTFAYYSSGIHVGVHGPREVEVAMNHGLSE